MADQRRKLQFPPMQTFPSTSVSIAAVTAAAIQASSFQPASFVGQLIKSVQFVQVVIPAATASNSVAITLINGARAVPLFAGSSGGASITLADSQQVRWAFSGGGASLTATRNADANSTALTLNVYVLEFF